jgi:GH18 family chitinase
MYRDKYGVPASKLNLGLAYYARSWKHVDDGGTGGLYQPGKYRNQNEGEWEFGTEGFYTIKKWESKPSYKYSFDNISKVPYLYDTKNKYFYTYDDEISINEKCKYVIKNGYGGIFFWELTGDYPGGRGDLLTSIIYNNFYNSRNGLIHENKSLETILEKNKLIFINKSNTPIKIKVFNINGNEIEKIELNKDNPTWKKSFKNGIYYYKIGNSKDNYKFMID